MKKLLGGFGGCNFGGTTARTVWHCRENANSTRRADGFYLRGRFLSQHCRNGRFHGGVAGGSFGDTNYDWVERAELEKVADEFKLAGFGLIDRSEAIRSGRWVKADWGIFGDVSTNWNGNRKLSLEVVDLQRADVLVETNLLLSTTEDGPFG